MATGTVRDLDDAFPLPPHSCTAGITEVLLKIKIKEILESF